MADHLVSELTVLVANQRSVLTVSQSRPHSLAPIPAMPFAWWAHPEVEFPPDNTAVLGEATNRRNDQAHGICVM